jgi:hypothetical protein
MASGHVNRTQRPNTWLHRPSLQREDSSWQLGAVHTRPIVLKKSEVSVHEKSAELPTTPSIDANPRCKSV